MDQQFPDGYVEDPNGFIAARFRAAVMQILTTYIESRGGAEFVATTGKQTNSDTYRATVGVLSLAPEINGGIPQLAVRSGGSKDVMRRTLGENGVTQETLESLRYWIGNPQYAISPNVGRYLRGINQILCGALRYIGFVGFRGQVDYTDDTAENCVTIEADYVMEVLLQIIEGIPYLLVRVPELDLRFKFCLGVDEVSAEDVAELFGKLHSARDTENAPLRENVIGQLETLSRQHERSAQVRVSPHRPRPDQIFVLELHTDTRTLTFDAYLDEDEGLVFRFLRDPGSDATFEIEPPNGLTNDGLRLLEELIYPKSAQ